ncbi:hypothetical protein F2Q70_00009163 [Brassica cretica]|uniref:Uncharacterized protein n=1 Tax=Brassica cretica TaxID=69181 RepID=A0A8S9M1X5_BRACR|nr:hypothetical protein F2Q70_00009163 [Brassica cretica]
MICDFRIFSQPLLFCLPGLRRFWVVCLPYLLFGFSAVSSVVVSQERHYGASIGSRYTPCLNFQYATLFDSTHSSLELRITLILFPTTSEVSFLLEGYFGILAVLPHGALIPIVRIYQSLFPTLYCLISTILSTLGLRDWLTWIHFWAPSQKASY